MEKSKTVLKEIDFIGAQLNPTFNRRNVISTAMGGFISAIILVTMIVATGFFGQELFYRQKALVRSYSKINNDSAVYTEEFSLSFSLWTRNGILLNMHPDILSEIKISGVFFGFKLNDQGIAEPFVKPFPITFCTLETIGKEGAELLKQSGFDIRYLWCMDLSGIPSEDRRVAQVLGTPGSSTININIHKCDSALTPKCGSFMKEYGNLNFVIGIVDKFIDVSDFANPVKTRLKNYITPISDSIEANMKIAIGRNFLLSDVGYIFSEEQNENFISFDNYERNFSSVNTTTKQLLYMEFLANTIESYTERQYLKVQEFLANMGGFFKGILFVANLINYPNAYTSLVNQIANVESKHAQEIIQKIPFRIKKHDENPRVAEESAAEIASEIPKNVMNFSVWEFLKNILCCKWKQNANLKNNSLMCLDLQEMIRQKMLVCSLMEKVQVLETASL